MQNTFDVKLAEGGIAVQDSIKHHPGNRPLAQAGNTVSALSLENVTKVYPDGSKGIEDISLTIKKGQVFSLLGPNGAGKSTLMRIICGLMRPTSGQISVAGIDPYRKPRALKEKLCGLLQNTPLEPEMRVWETLQLFSKFYRSPLNPQSLLDLVGLRDKAQNLIRTLSGGQKQRLAIARALIGNPEILVLDEPTTGLDVAIRLELMTLIRRLREEGRTIVISTHYIEEAEKYCDEVAVLHKGKLFVVDTPDGLVRKYGTGDKLEIILTKPVSCEKLSSIAGILGVQELRSSADAATYILSGQHGEYMLEQTVLGLIDSNVQLREARIIRSGLEGAYLHLTGERIPS